MKITKDYPNLANFLADHFGGYDSAEQAAQAEGQANARAYLQDFLETLPRDCSETELQKAEDFCAKYAPRWDELRRKTGFDECGAAPVTGTIPAIMAELINLWN